MSLLQEDCRRQSVLIICNVNSLNITILHTNDFHGRFEETNQFSFTCDEKKHNKDGCFGGVARLAGAVKRIRATEDHVILLDGGDRFAGTIWSEVYKGNATQILVNSLNYTAITLGNHEFDYGLNNLQHFIEKVKCGVVVSNINTSNEPKWYISQDLVKKNVVIDVNGEKIGIVGYIIISTPRSSDSGSNIQFLPIIQSVQKAVDDLKSKGITKIIALGHAGFNVDKKIAQKVKGVDVVVGGHSNTFLYTGVPPSNEKPQGPYPFIVHPDHNKSLSVPVVQAYAYSKYLGHLKVTFNIKGEVTSWHGNPILLDHKIMKDPEVNEIVEKWKVVVDKKGNTVIGQSKVTLDGANKVCTLKQCSLGMVVVDSMVHHYRSDNVTIALFNGGSISASLPVDNQGNVFYKDLFNSFPYRNTIDLVELSGANIIRSLQVSGYLQVKGLRVKYYSLEPKRKVDQVEIEEIPCPSKSCFKPINSSKIYKVVVNSYLVNGGNQIITTQATNRRRGNDGYDVIVEYFKANSPITTGTEINNAFKLKQDLILFFVIISWFVL